MRKAKMKWQNEGSGWPLIVHGGKISNVRFADDDITRVEARNQTNASIFYLLQDGEG